MKSVPGQVRELAVRKAIERAPSMFAYWDNHLRCRFANNACRRWFGVDAQTLVGTSIETLFGPNLFALDEPYIRAALRGDEQSFQRVVPGPDGAQRQSLVHYLPDIMDGEVQGFVFQLTDVTPLKDTEAELDVEASELDRAGRLLRQNEAALRQAQRLGQIGSWHWEVGADITTWSEELYRIFGRDPARLPPCYAQHGDIYTAPSWAALQPAVARTLADGEPYILELEYVRPDGTTGWIEARGAAERDAQGAIVGLHGTALDITARREARQAQRKLATEGHFLERLEALTPGVVHVFDLERQCSVYISRSVENTLGYSQEEVYAMGANVVPTLMHADDRRRFGQHLGRLRMAGDNETVDFEFRMQHRAGEWRWFQSRDAVFSRNELGEVRELIGTAIDIAGPKQAEEALLQEIFDRKQAQAELQREGALLDALVQNAPIGLCFIDRDLRFVRINDSLAEINGIAALAHLGRHVSEVVPALSETLRAVTDRILATGVAVLDHEFCGETPAAPGVQRCWNESWFPVRDGSDEVVGFGAIVQETTARKQAEDTIARQLRELNALYATSPTGLFQFDADLRFVRVNAWTAAINGRAVEAHIGRTVHEVLGPQADQVEGLLRQVLQTGEPLLEVELHGTTDAHIDARDWLASYYPVRSASGKVVGVHGVVQDITAQKHARAALLESEKRYRLLFEQAAQGIFVADDQGRYTDVNEAACRMLGYTRHEILSLAIPDVIAEEEIATLAPRLALTAGGEVITTEWRFRRKDGSFFTGEIAGCQRPDGYYQGTLSDISARKQAQASLLASEQFSRSVLESSPDCVKVLDGDGRLQFMNANGCALMEIDDFEPLRGQPWCNLWPSADTARVRDAVAKAVNGQSSRFQTFVPTAKGTPKWWDVIVTPAASRPGGGGALQLISVSRDITAQKQAEQELRIRDRAIAASGAGVFLVDPHAPDFPIVYASEGFERMTGYTAAEVLGQNYHFLEGSDTDPTAVARLQEAVHAHTPVRLTLINYRKDGAPFWNDIAISPVTDAHGQVTHLVGIQNDVSAMYAMQTSLQASRDSLALGVAVAGLALAEVNYATGLNHLTAEAARAFGLGETAIVVPRDRVHATFHPDDREELSRRVAASLDPTGPGCFAMDHRVVWPDGQVRWLTVRKQVVFTGEGPSRCPERAVLAALDVTDRKTADANLMASYARIQLAADATAVGIWELNVLNNTIHWDAQMFRLYGIAPTPDGLVPYNHWRSAVVPEDLQEQERLLQQTVHLGGRKRRAFRIHRQDDGMRRDIEAVETARENADGQTEWIVGSNLDVTDRNEAERQLRHAAAALTEADRRKDDFLATLSHELRNPLAPIRNALEVIKRANGNLALLERARATADRQVAQMVRLIDDLLDVSRITRDKLTLSLERIELASIVHQAVETCQPHCDREGQTLHVKLPPVPVYLYADSVRLAQVFGNLLNNASKYTGAGGRIELVAELQGEEVAVMVRDNGIGIPADMLARVFDLFTQVDASRNLSKGGLGIGLALAKRLTGMHGGTLTVRSEGRDLGSEFVVHLPLMREERDPAMSSASAVSEEPPVALRRILVVDDNLDSAESLATLLALDGHETLMAHDGLDAVEKAKLFRPEFILLDIGLPQLDGYETCRRIRDQPGSQDIVIIALTGWGQADDRRKSTAAGFDAHWVKPVDHAVLLDLLTRPRTRQH